jgi:hypothetical protein
LSFANNPNLTFSAINNIWETAMAETAPVVHIGENSPEQIAYKLLETIASNEKKTLHWSVGSTATADRKWLLDTYAECLVAVSGERRGPDGDPMRMVTSEMTVQEAADAYAELVKKKR